MKKVLMVALLLIGNFSTLAFGEVNQLSNDSDETVNFRSFNEIADALNPLDVLAVHDGIKRSIDLHVQFDFNSAALKPSAMRQIEVLAQAIKSRRLHGYKLLIIGHTDASGSAEYNLELSTLRADSFKQALISQYDIAPERLASEGKGETQLLKRLPQNDARQRRVEIVAIKLSNQEIQMMQMNAQSEAVPITGESLASPKAVQEVQVKESAEQQNSEAKVINW